MVRGLGIDLVDIARIADLIDRQGDSFVERVFRTEEIAYCRAQKVPARHFAGRFAAKEAMMKMLGTGWGNGVGWHDVAVRESPEGPPIAEITGKAREAAMQCGIDKVLLSISHTDSQAIAIAMGQAG